MLTKITSPKEIWDSLCGTSAKEHPFRDRDDVKRYLETVVVKEGVNCFDVPPFNSLSIVELSEILWGYQVTYSHNGY